MGAFSLLSLYRMSQLSTKGVKIKNETGNYNTTDTHAQQLQKALESLFVPRISTGHFIMIRINYHDTLKET